MKARYSPLRKPPVPRIHSPEHPSRSAPRIDCSPAHPFRLRRQIPFLWIEVRYQSRLDPSLSSVSAICRIVELGIGRQLVGPRFGGCKTVSRRLASTRQRRVGFVRATSARTVLVVQDASGAKQNMSTTSMPLRLPTI